MAMAMTLDRMGKRDNVSSIPLATGPENGLNPDVV